MSKPRLPSLALAAALAALSAFPLAPARAADVAADPIESVLVLAVEGDVFVNADGSIADYRIDTPAPGDTAAKVLRVVQGWHFEPVVVEGKPQPVVARMRVALAATKNGEDFRVRVDGVSFPGVKQLVRERAEAEGKAPRLAGDRKLPAYPRGLAKAGVDGRVLVALRYDASGQVTDAAAVQSMLFDRRERDQVSARAIELFEHAALAAVRQWRVELPAGTPSDQPRIAYVAVAFMMENGDPRNAEDAYPGRWRMVSRTPRRYVEWLDTRRTGAPSLSDVADGTLVPVADAALKLREPVVDTLL